MGTGSDRIHFIDLFRGFAVVLMVLGHTIDAVLDLKVRSTQWFAVYDFLRGFTAPAFLFVSGLAFAIATERDWKGYTTWSPRLRKRLARILLLFCIGYALHLPYFSLQKTLFGATPEEITAFLKTDVLQCIAACLLVLHALILLARKPLPFVRIVLGFAVLIVILSPIIWATRLSPPLSTVLTPYFHDKPLSVFPLFPYASFMFAGVATGHFYLRALRENREGAFVVGIATLSAIGTVAAVALDLTSVDPYPNHDFWKTSPIFFVLRIAGVIQLTVLFYLLRELPGRFQPHLTLLGQSSLLIYSTHIVLVYGSATNKGLLQTVGQTQPLVLAVATALAMLLLMTLIARLWEGLRRTYPSASRYLQVGLAATVLFIFLVKPF